jgi:hypothetical protein
MAWKFDKPLATLQLGAFSARVDVSSPQFGLHNLHVESKSLEGCLLRVECEAPSTNARSHWPVNVVDVYVRGDDLVATFEASTFWPFAPQVYWRANTFRSIEGVLASVAVEVSLSTHLLDTQPEVDAVTRLAAEQVLQVVPLSGTSARTIPLPVGNASRWSPSEEASCILWRLPGGRLSYAEMVPASDFRTAVLRRTLHGDFEGRWKLIAEFLEKGVIRRMRAYAALLPRENDVELAAECCRTVAARPLPLTT